MIRSKFSVLVCSAVIALASCRLEEGGLEQIDEPPGYDTSVYYGLTIKGKLYVDGELVDDGDLDILWFENSIVTDCYDSFRSGEDKIAEIAQDGSMFHIPSSPELVIKCPDLLLRQQVALCAAHKNMELAQTPVTTVVEPVNNLLLISLDETDVFSNAHAWNRLPWPQYYPDGNVDPIYQRYFCEQPTHFDPPDNWSPTACHHRYVIPPQRTETRTLFLIMAEAYYRTAAIASLETAEPMVVSDAVTSNGQIYCFLNLYEAWGEYLSSETLGDGTTSDPSEILSASFTESVEGHIESLESLVRNQACVADSCDSKYPDLGEGRLHEWQDPINSRFGIIHSIYGGDPEMGDSLAASAVDLSVPGIRSAVSILRDRGVLLEIEDGEIATLSPLVQAFEEDVFGIFRNEEGMIPLDGLDGISDAEFLAYMGVSEVELIAAQQYLDEEIAVYRRPLIVHEPYRESAMSRSATMLSAPYALPIRILFAEKANEMWYRSEGDFTRLVHPAEYSPAQMLGTIRLSSANAVNFLKTAQDEFAASNNLNQRLAFATGALAAGQAIGEMDVYIIDVYEELNDPPGSPISLYGPLQTRIGVLFPALDEEDRLVAFQGWDSTTAPLQCFERHMMEGEACPEDAFIECDDQSGCEISDPTFFEGLRDLHPLQNDMRALVLNYANYEFYKNIPIYIYLVKADGSKNLITMIKPKMHRYAADHSIRFIYYPVEGHLEELSRDFVIPAPGNCGKPLKACTNIYNIKAPPLENEIIDNSNEWEDSWRHYLDNAAQAAFEADMLGQELVQYGLEMDMRAEAALEELEENCGGLWSNIDLYEKGGECESAEECVPDLDQRDEDITISQCLPDEGNLRDVSLGSRTGCFAVHNGILCGCDSQARLDGQCDAIYKACMAASSQFSEESCTISNLETKLPVRDPDESYSDRGYSAIYLTTQEEKRNVLGIFRPYQSDLPSPSIQDRNCMALRAVHRMGFCYDPTPPDEGWPDPAADGFLIEHCLNRSNGIWDGTNCFYVVNIDESRCGSPPYDETIWIDLSNGLGNEWEENLLDEAVDWISQQTLLDANQSILMDNEFGYIYGLKIGGQTIIQNDRSLCNASPEVKEEMLDTYYKIFGDPDNDLGSPCGSDPENSYSNAVQRSSWGARVREVVASLGILSGKIDNIMFSHYISKNDINSIVEITTGGNSPEDMEYFHLMGRTIDDEILGPEYSVLYKCLSEDTNLFSGSPLCYVLVSDENCLASGSGVCPEFPDLQECSDEGRCMYSSECTEDMILPRGEMGYNEVLPCCRGCWKKCKTNYVADQYSDALSLLFTPGMENWKTFIADYSSSLGVKPTSEYVTFTDNSCLLSLDHYWIPFFYTVFMRNDYYPFPFLENSHDIEFNLIRNGRGTVTGAEGHWKGFKVLSDTPTARNTLLNSLELACHTRVTEGLSCGVDTVKDIAEMNMTTTDDLGGLINRIQCVANQIQEISSRITISNVPREVVDAFNTSEEEIFYPDRKGEVLRNINGIIFELQQFQSASKGISDVLGNISISMYILKKQIEGLDLQRDIQHLRSIQSIVLTALEATVSTIESKGMTAGQSFALAAANTTFEMMIMDLQSQLTEVEEDALIGEYLRNYLAPSLTELRSLQDSIRASSTQIQNYLSGYEQTLNANQRLMAKATFADSDASGRVYPVNTVMRRRYNTTLIRYQNALEKARKMADLAKRAIEFKFGVDFNKMTDPMLLVEAPATWANDVYTMQGMNYEEIRLSCAALPDDDEEQAQCTDIDDYADAFIGDYVDKLSLFVESYSDKYPFSNGDDVAVLSLKDDLLAVRESCEVESNNLIYSSGDLIPTTMSGDTVGAWFTGRDSADSGYCINVLPDKGFDGYSLADPSDPLFIPEYYNLLTSCNNAVPSFCPVDADRIFDVPDEGLITEPPLIGVDCSTDGFLAQRLESEGPGCYLISWYARGVPQEGLDDPVYTGDYRIEVRYGSDDTVWTLDDYSMAWEYPIGTGLEAIRWEDPMSDPPGLPKPRIANRFILYDDAPQLEIRIYPSAESDLSGIGAVEIYALQLEYLGDISACSSIEIQPGPYEKTDNRRVVLLPSCHDLDGSTMRSPPIFSYKCDYLCPSGLTQIPCDPVVDGEVNESAVLQRCYYETTFGITLSELERGDLIPSGNIAIGNFNYRTLEVGVNFVGTNIIDCTLSPTPSTCYSNSFLEYSLEHGGNVWIRNHEGDDVSYSLTNAWIEHAKGIAAEMVFTNPVTSSHASLIQDYMKPEFRGRPLTGQYTLKIWDTPELNWNAVEDIQMLVRYRYWTRHTD